MMLGTLHAPDYAGWTALVTAPWIGSFVASRLSNLECYEDYPVEPHIASPVLRPPRHNNVPWHSGAGRFRLKFQQPIARRSVVIIGAYVLVTYATAATSRSEIFSFGCLLGWVLLALALIDIKTYRLPDALTLPLLGAGIAVTMFLNSEIVFDHIIAGAIGFLSLYIVSKTYAWIAGQEGLGLGDAKLFAATGAWLGAVALPGALLIAASTGLAVELIRRRLHVSENTSAPIAFGPYLALATWIGWVLGPLVPASP